MNKLQEEIGEGEKKKNPTQVNSFLELWTKIWLRRVYRCGITQRNRSLADSTPSTEAMWRKLQQYSQGIKWNSACLDQSRRGSGWGITKLEWKGRWRQMQAGSWAIRGTFSEGARCLHSQTYHSGRGLRTGNRTRQQESRAAMVTWCSGGRLQGADRRTEKSCPVQAAFRKNDRDSLMV